MTGKLKAACLVLVVGCSVGSVYTQANSGPWKKYISPKKTYSLSFPSDWTVSIAKPLPSVPAYEPPDQLEKDVRADAPNARVGVLINVTKVDALETLESYYSRQMRDARMFSVRTFRIAEERDFTAGPLRGKKLIYSFVSQDQHHWRVEHRVVILVDRRRGVTISALAGTPEEFTLLNISSMTLRPVLGLQNKDSSVWHARGD
jgi:hypothetical protein